MPLGFATLDVVLRTYPNRINGRSLYALAIASAGELSELSLPELRHFACLVVWDASNAKVAELERCIAPLLRNGASYLVFWGAGCRLMHEVADELIVAMRDELGLRENITIMTTDHHGESLEEAVWYFLTLTHPVAPLCDTTSSGLVLCVGTGALLPEIEEQLRGG